MSSLFATFYDGYVATLHLLSATFGKLIVYCLLVSVCFVAVIFYLLNVCFVIIELIAEWFEPKAPK